MKISVLTNMMPTTIHDFIYSTVLKGTQYTTVKEKVKAIIQKQTAANSGLFPMHIGEAGSRMDDAGSGHGGNYEDFIAEHSVGVVDMSAKCYGCQEYGHMSADCGTKSEKGNGNEGTARGRVQVCAARAAAWMARA